MCQPLWLWIPTQEIDEEQLLEFYIMSLVFTGNAPQNQCYTEKHYITITLCFSFDAQGTRRSADPTSFKQSPGRFDPSPDFISTEEDKI